MNKIFTLLLSAILCTASPVFAMDPSFLDLERQNSSPKKIIFQGNDKKKEMSSIQELSKGSTTTLEIEVLDANDSVLKVLSKGIKSNTTPFALEVHLTNDLTAKGIGSLAKIIENNKLTNLNISLSKDFTRFSWLLECLNVCPHVKQATFCCDNFLEDTIQLSKAFPSLNKLQILCKLPSIEFLESFSQLTYLQLKSHIYEEICPLGHLTNLTYLNLANCYFGEIDFHPFGHLTNLHTLNLSANDIPACSISSISIHCSSLTDLNLSDNFLKDVGALAVADHFVKLSALKKLHFGNNMIGNRGILALVKNLTQLASLSVYDNLMDDEGGKLLAEELGTRFDAKNLRETEETALITPRLAIDVSYNKMTQSLRTSLHETLSSRTNSSVGVNW